MHLEGKRSRSPTLSSVSTLVHRNPTLLLTFINLWVFILGGTDARSALRKAAEANPDPHSEAPPQNDRTCNFPPPYPRQHLNPNNLANHPLPQLPLALSLQRRRPSRNRTPAFLFNPTSNPSPDLPYQPSPSMESSQLHWIWPRQSVPNTRPTVFSPVLT